MKLAIGLFAIPLACVSPACRAEQSTSIRHVIVYGEQGKFAGWPAGHGAWNWGNELLVGFSLGTYKAQEGHAMDRKQPEHHVLGRSHDGGVTWRIERPADRGMLVNLNGMRKGITDPALTEPSPKPLTQPINFAHPDFCMTLRLTQIQGGSSRLYYSYDRGSSWAGPFQVPSFRQPGVMARTDYLVEGANACLAFLTVAKADHREGRVIATRLTDGGLNWDICSFVGPEPSGFSIMPSTVRAARGRLVMTTRRREGDRRWIDVWQSPDDADSWQPIGIGVPDLGRGNPPSLIRLADGRLCLTYGVRKPPYEIQAKLSQDGGRSWSQPYVLRTDGGGWDMGYPRTLQRPDGKIVCVYYYHAKTSPTHRIEAAIWDPPASL